MEPKAKGRKENNYDFLWEIANCFFLKTNIPIIL